MELELRIINAINKLENILKNDDKEKLLRMNLSVFQIKKIIFDLKQMKCNMNPNKFYPSYVHMIIDSWDSKEENELSDELIKIAKIYNKM